MVIVMRVTKGTCTTQGGSLVSQDNYFSLTISPDSLNFAVINDPSALTIMRVCGSMPNAHILGVSSPRSCAKLPTELKYLRKQWQQSRVIRSVRSQQFMMGVSLLNNTTTTMKDKQYPSRCRKWFKK